MSVAITKEESGELEVFAKHSLILVQARVCACVCVCVCVCVWGGGGGVGGRLTHGTGHKWILTHRAFGRFGPFYRYLLPQRASLSERARQLSNQRYI